MLRRFLFPPIERLSADGLLEPLDGAGASGRLPVVLLARDLCAFEFHVPAGGASATGLASARLRAGQASPFVNAGALIRRHGAGYAIWWWDLDVVGPALTARFGPTLPRLAPASLAQPSGGDSWRVVRSEPGFEAQFWRQDVLRASTWRLQSFDQASWSAFTRIQRETDAPAQPPAPQSLPMDWTRARAALTRDLSLREIGLAAAATLVAGMVLSTAFLVGQGLRLRDQTQDLVEAASALPAPAATPLRESQRLRSYRSLSQRPDPVAALARAMGVVELYGTTPIAYATDPGQVTLTLPYSAISSLNRIALELRDSGLFTEIRPTTDDDGGRIELRLTLAGAPVSPDE